MHTRVTASQAAVPPIAQEDTITTCLRLAQKCRHAALELKEMGTSNAEIVHDFARDVELAACACLTCLNKTDEKWNEQFRDTPYINGFRPADHFLRLAGSIDVGPSIDKTKRVAIRMGLIREACQMECLHFLSAPVVHRYLLKAWVGGRVKQKDIRRAPRPRSSTVNAPLS